MLEFLRYLCSFSTGSLLSIWDKDRVLGQSILVRSRLAEAEGSSLKPFVFRMSQIKTRQNANCSAYNSISKQSSHLKPNTLHPDIIVPNVAFKW